MAKDSKSVTATNPEGANGEKSLSVADLGMGDARGVDKIRDLLFGNQMQDYDRRFSMLAEGFHQKLRDVESETARSLSSLEANLKKQLDSIAGQVREEKDLRTDADKELDHKPARVEPGAGEAHRTAVRPTRVPGAGHERSRQPRCPGLA